MWGFHNKPRRNNRSNMSTGVYCLLIRDGWDIMSRQPLLSFHGTWRYVSCCSIRIRLSPSVSINTTLLWQVIRSKPSRWREDDVMNKWLGARDKCKTCDSFDHVFFVHMIKLHVLVVGVGSPISPIFCDKIAISILRASFLCWWKIRTLLWMQFMDGSKRRLWDRNGSGGWVNLKGGLWAVRIRFNLSSSAPLGLHIDVSFPTINMALPSCQHKKRKAHTQSTLERR